MPEPTPPLDLAALEALVQAHHLPDACSACDHYDDTASFVLPALVARVRALEAEVARLQARVGAAVPVDVDAPPVAQCSACGRFTWSLVDVEQRCGLRQPDGLDCPGLYL